MHLMICCKCKQTAYDFLEIASLKDSLLYLGMHLQLCQRLNCPLPIDFLNTVSKIVDQWKAALRRINL